MSKKENRFGRTTPVMKADEFFGRKKEIQSIVSILRTGAPCAIVGPRRIGKSSLLYYFSYSQYLKELNLPFSMATYVDGSRARDAKAFLQEVAKVLQTKVEIGSSLDVDDLDGLFEYIEGALAEGTTESGIPLLLMDEVENLARPEFSDVLNWNAPEERTSINCCR